ncbi:13003_t:CDS:2 [Ambispora leptoticha]|uniref:13003_t:CDS:1 n=1 Tax=Ambispora leptoticha TaxID=144679 RepID=A0A9N8Z563_9GLOM|nr:13003_t:CDS:2 [Ambispora leptoticha]
MVHPLQIKIHPTEEDDDDHPLSAKIDDAPNSAFRFSSDEKNPKLPAGPGLTRSLSSTPRTKATRARTSEERRKRRTNKTTWQKIKRIYRKNEKLIFILWLSRLSIAFSLYFLILIDVIHLKQKKEKSFWIEMLTQLINAEFTLITIILHPKRLRNLPRAWKIMRASGGGNVDGGHGVPEEIRQQQMKVQKDYDWYTYQGEKKFRCPPSRLFLILILWNIGSIGQYCLASILWFIRPGNRPIIAYILISIFTFICEFGPVPYVFIQRKRSRELKGRTLSSSSRSSLTAQSEMRDID